MNYKKAKENFFNSILNDLDKFEDKLDDIEDSVEEFELEEPSLDDLDYEEESNEGIDLDDFDFEHAEEQSKLPGSDSYIHDIDDDEIEKESLGYKDDPKPEKFFEYLVAAFDDIPRHSGDSIAGCERAIAYLNDLDKEILMNIKGDKDHVLDIDKLNEYQEKILAGILELNKRVKSLKEKIKDKVKEEKKAFDVSDMITKEAAGTMKIYLSVSPFIKAICGILINSVVSAGKPFDLVYDYLKTKYEIKPREELEILEVLKDMGQPIFKDRGSMPGTNDSEDVKKMEEELGGVDFITNYFA